MRAPEYIQVLRQFTLELEARGIVPSEIVFQQVKTHTFYQTYAILTQKIHKRFIFATYM